MIQGILFLLVGPSGSGKTSIIEGVLETVPSLQRFVTYTTRLPRPDEVNERDYFFTDHSGFERLKNEGRLIEWQEFYGNSYGSSKKSLESLVANGIDGIAAYDVLGAKQLFALYPESIITIFVVPPSIEEIHKRIIERYGSLTVEAQMRLARFEFEMQCIGDFQYVVENSNLIDSISDVQSIIRAQRCARRSKAYRQLQSSYISSTTHKH